MVKVRESFEDPQRHLAWRFQAAEAIEAAYGPSPNLTAVAAAGSVGAGWADRWSDLEVDCYWREPPSEDDRRRPIHVLGGHLTAFWDYDQDDQEWSEDYELRGLAVTISNFTVATVETFLDSVLNARDLGPSKHYRLAAIANCRPLRGAQTLQVWRTQVATYPDALVRAVVEAALNPERFPGWTARRALAERGDTIAVHSLLAAVTRGIFSAVLAINRTFQAHRLPKWQRRVLSSLPRRPTDLEVRLDRIWHEQPALALATAEELLYDTIALAEAELRLHLGTARDAFAEHRRAMNAPSGGP